MTEIIYRKSRKSDLEAIIRLWREMMEEHARFDPRVRLSETAEDAYGAYVSYYMGSEEASCLAAQTLDARVVGFCLCYVSQNLPMFEPRNFGFISDVVVHEDFRRRGIGDQLVARAKAWLRNKGIRVVQLQVYDHNEPARAFWARQGFEPLLSRQWLEL